MQLFVYHWSTKQNLEDWRVQTCMRLKKDIRLQYTYIRGNNCVDNSQRVATNYDGCVFFAAGATHLFFTIQFFIGMS